MKRTPLQKQGIADERIVLGCMGLGGSWDNSPITDEDILLAERALDAALESGITMFDHADIYKTGKAEEVFGRALQRTPELRETLVLQSKCGIRFPDDRGPARYDFSREHILSSVDGILSRLGTEYLDILLLHRPDPLMEPEEVAEAFAELKTSGKVRHFGVSNMSAPQMQLLQAYLMDPLVVNQMEMNLHKIDWIEQGVLVNQAPGTDVNFPESLVEYCRLENIQLQAWAPLASGLYSGRDMEDAPEEVVRTRDIVAQMAEEKEASREAIVLGWLMRHPAMIQPVIGTTNPERIKQSADAIRIAEQMTREEWYTLYVASRGRRMP